MRAGRARVRVKKCTYQATVIRIGGLIDGWIAEVWQLTTTHTTRMPFRAIHSCHGVCMPRVKISMPEEFLFTMRYPVGISDLNYAKHLNSVAMVHIVHEARLQFLANLGFTEANIFGLGMVVTDIAVDYRSESFANDVLIIDVGVGRFNRYGCDVCFQITNSALDRVVCNAKMGIVFFDFDKHKIAPVPKAFRELLGQNEDSL